MKCPKCEGKVKVVLTGNEDKENEIYRRRKCLDCGYGFYTIEFELDDPKDVKNLFASNS